MHLLSSFAFRQLGRLASDLLPQAAQDCANTQVAMSHPLAVTNCNIDMETLISDHNRSIATLAITTLLKTGNENSIERLIKQACPLSGSCI